MFNSESYIIEFLKRLRTQVENITNDYEIVLVNDGSPDRSFEISKELAEHDNRIIIIDLSRNFGQHRALMTGLRYAKGDLVFFIDCDLEIEPEVLELFYERFITEVNCDVVFGVQKRRKASLFQNICGNMFYKIIKFLSDYDLPANVVAARLMTRRYVESLLLHTEREIFMSGLFFITGYKQVKVDIEKKYKGKTTYSFSKRVQIFFNAISSFSKKPLEYIFYFGALVSTTSFGFILYLIFRWLFFSQPPKGWSSLIISVWFLSGLIILFIGIIGIYLSRIFSETKNRPYSIVKEVINGEYK
jgi:putative glycosyltransferase